MTIACLGWGSLIWRNDGLSCDQDWQVDGPMLPVEFARMSRNGEVTLVVLEGVPEVPVQWCRMLTEDLNEAIEALRVREGRTRLEWIGSWSRGAAATDKLTATVGAWADKHDISGVVWTALPAKWNDTVGRVPTLDEILAYLEELEPARRALARKYILKAPEQIKTPFRGALTAWAEGSEELE